MSAKKRIHLICNAHLDPVWQWQWEEGAGEALSTFRTAADLCEEFEGLIFNHNEVILYEWVRRLEPELFKRIQKLVRQGKWHIMGGWFLQPDCNIPAGESLVRQMLWGREYFREHFGVEPTTAINFDPFGHAQGLVQLLVKSGYDSYLFGRPGDIDPLVLPDQDFTWVGVEGSEVTASRFVGWYNHELGHIDKKLDRWVENHPDPNLGILLWGVGDHGGGPSREDLKILRRLAKEKKDVELIHSTPEDYFADLKRSGKQLKKFKRDLNPSMKGCYASMVRIKQKHRRLENELFATEKMLATAVGQGLMAYPQEQMDDATRDLLFGQFHDILPGSSIPAVEEDSLRLFDHGLEIVSRIKAEAFFKLVRGEKRVEDHHYAIFAHNPHPYPVKTIIECEFQLPDICLEENHYTIAEISHKGRPVAAQPELEAGNVPADWRTKMVFAAELPPAQMSRFDCTLKTIKQKPAPRLAEKNGKITFKTKELNVVINTRTGLVDRYRVNGVEQIRPGAFLPIVMEDDEDPWGMRRTAYEKVVGPFKLMPRKAGSAFSGLPHKNLNSVRVIEDGPVRSIVEAVFSYGSSFICQRYKLPKQGTEMEVETRVLWNEKDRCLKLSVPTRGRDAEYVGQTVFGTTPLPGNGDEAVAQKWTAVVSKADKRALTCINDGIYSSDFNGQALRLTLLRSPSYTAHPFEGRDMLPQDRFRPRIDQGERLFRFWFNGGPSTKRLQAIDREAMAHNETPFVIPFNPPGSGPKPKAGLTLSDDVVQLTCFKKAAKGNDWIIRLFEPTGRARSTTLTIPFAGVRKKIELDKFEIKTFKVNLKSGKMVETDLREKTIRRKR